MVAQGKLKLRARRPGKGIMQRVRDGASADHGPGWGAEAVAVAVVVVVTIMVVAVVAASSAAMPVGVETRAAGQIGRAHV